MHRSAPTQRLLIPLPAAPLLAALLLAALCLVGACGSPTPTLAPAAVPPTAVPPTATAPAATVDPFFAAHGGGEPRTAGYWLVWNSCAEGNQAETARANGGREAGWVILDDLLADPGILLGELAVETCELGIRLLQGQDTAGVTHPDDLAYPLAAQLLTAQANLAVGAEYCPASDEAVQAGQVLLLSLGFDGSGERLAPDAEAHNREVAQFLIDKLREYNAGGLCR